MERTVELSVILCTYNSAETVVAQLEALSRQEWSEPWEVVVSDNGSVDATLEMIERFKRRLPGLRVVDSSDRRGLGHACNVGAAAASGSAIAFCNDDDEVGAGWVAAMGNALREHELVGGRLEHERLNEQWNMGVRGRPHADSLPVWRLGGYMSFAFGCTIGVQRELHERIGGFDENMLPASEDMDYCWRAQLAGAELRFVPEALTHYRLRHSLRAIYQQARNYGEGDVVVVKKHRTLGMRTPPRQFWGTVRGWGSIAAALTRVRKRSDLAVVAWRLGWAVGLVRGSARHRVLLLLRP